MYNNYSNRSTLTLISDNKTAVQLCVSATVFYIINTRKQLGVLSIHKYRDVRKNTVATSNLWGGWGGGGGGGGEGWQQMYSSTASPD